MVVAQTIFDQILVAQTLNIGSVQCAILLWRPWAFLTLFPLAKSVK
jgi:hypothetical protein